MRNSPQILISPKICLKALLVVHTGDSRVIILNMVKGVFEVISKRSVVFYHKYDTKY